MWKLIRPDTVIALEDPLVKKILPRYVEVVQDKLPARFQIAKRIAFDFNKSMNNKQLWLEHGKLMKKFYETKKDIDKRKLKLEDLEVPKFSLLDLKIMLTKEIMKSCELCERKCRVNRLKGKLGVCRVGNECLISSEFMHFGEEFHISPSHTIFFMGCTLHCQFCQNYSISQWYETGYSVVTRQLADMIERRREEGSRNVNFVGGEPTPSLLWILEALKLCKVNVPTIWNSNFYMSGQAMQILDGVIDMHLSDFKYGNNECALRLSKIQKYFDICSRNHSIAAKTTEITLRHLILPNHIGCCTKLVLDWIVQNIHNKVIVNLMDQYSPQYKAHEYSDIGRRITEQEFEEAINYAKKLKINFIT